MKLRNNNLNLFLAASLAVFAIACGGSPGPGNLPDQPDDPSGLPVDHGHHDGVMETVTSCDDPQANWLTGLRASCSDEAGDTWGGVIHFQEREGGCFIETRPDAFDGVIVTRPPKDAAELFALLNNQSGNAIVANHDAMTLRIYHVEDPGGELTEFPCNLTAQN